VSWSLSGVPHPVPRVKVEIRDAEGGGPSALVASVFTGADGKYTATFANDDGIGQGGLDIFVRLIVENDNGTNIEREQLGFTFSKDSALHPEVAEGAVLDIPMTPDLTSSGDAGDYERDLNGALSILHAITEAELYMLSLTGTRPDGIEGNYPSPLGTQFVGAGFNSMNVGFGDQFQWDAVHHEYGHYVSNLYDLDDDPIGNDMHTIDENLAESYRSKDRGVKVAWTEGFANYFAIVVQRARGHKALGIPAVGDENFGDPTDAAPMESSDGSRGEDNEASVMRILWDLDDRVDDGRDRTTLGAQLVWATVIGSPGPGKLADLWNGLTAFSPGVEQLARYGGIFADHKVAPDPTGPADGTTLGDDTKFEWRANGNGESHKLNEFQIEFYSPDLATLHLTRGPIGLRDPADPIAEYSPSAADRQLIRSFGPVKWLVRGRNTTSPETGQYVSPLRTLGGVRLGFVIDVTGSMGEEIEGVGKALIRFIDSLAGEPTPPGLAVITFEDSPALRIASSDLGAVRDVVEGLGASGGDECPEASAQALLLAAETVSPGGVVFLATDADPHPGSDLAGAIAALRARRIRTNVLLSGSCTEEIAAASLAHATASRAVSVAAVEVLGVAADDDHGDSAAEATPTVPASAPLIGRLAPAGDVDFVSFSAVAGTAYRLATEGSDFDTLLTLYATDGTTQLDQNDDGGTDLTSLLFLTPTVGGVYYAAVSGFRGSTGSFQLVIEPSPTGGAALGAIQAYSQVAAETGGVYLFIPGVNAGGDEAQHYESAAVDVMIGAIHPSVPFVEPATVPQGATLVLTVHGLNTNFSSATTVSFAGGDIAAGAPTIRSATRLEVPVEIAAGALLGFRDVIVETPIGAAIETATGHDALRVTTPPPGAAITAIVPSTIAAGETAEVRVFGLNTHFGATSQLDLGSGLTVSDTTAVSPAELRALVTAGTEPDVLGYHNVTVTTGNEVAGESVPGPLLVVQRFAAGIPRLIRVTPAEGAPGDAITLRVAGENTHFEGGRSAAEFLPGGVRVLGARVVSPAVVDLDVEIDAAAPRGFRDLTVTTGAEVAVGLGLFGVGVEGTEGPTTTTSTTAPANTTTTTLPPTTTTTTLRSAVCASDADCNDDDPCTRACVDGVCKFEPLTGTDALLCGFERSLAVPACDGDVPKAVA